MNRLLVLCVSGSVLWMLWMVTSFMAFISLPVPIEVRIMSWLLVVAVASVYVGVVLLFALGAKA